MIAIIYISVYYIKNIKSTFKVSLLMDTIFHVSSCQ